jgi:predicted nucleotidyltransferase
MNPSDLQPHELMQQMADFCEAHAIPYRVVGSMASMAYGEPRLTIDIDIVVELQLRHIPALCAAFPFPDYYLSEAAARDAVVRHFQFNIIHPSSGLKVDLFVPAPTEYARTEAVRVQRITSPGEYSAWFGSPEDIVLNKLIYYQKSDGVSEKHLRDIAGMMKLLQEKLDRDYITTWAAKLGVTAEWELVRQRVDEATGS